MSIYIIEKLIVKVKNEDAKNFSKISRLIAIDKTGNLCYNDRYEEVNKKGK